VANFLQSNGVAPYRINTMGYGASMPVAGNDTSAGRQANRRVEIELKANQALYERSNRPRPGPMSLINRKVQCRVSSCAGPEPS